MTPQGSGTRLGQPGGMVAFCHIDSGDAYGFVIFERGMKIRRQVCTEERIIDEGTHENFERQTLHEWADDDEDTPGMLRCVLINLFGSCPWDDWSHRTGFCRYARHLL